MLNIVIGQNILKGYIQDSLQYKPVENVMVTLHDSAMHKTLAYGISNEQGYFEINITGNTLPMVVQAKALNFKIYQKTLHSISSPLIITLQHAITEIKEVTVKSGPISKRNDTISYRVDAFAQLNDRSIGDVIARMPGIEIGPDGKIYYLGKPIDKYYIEGMDLLEGKYNLANKNLPYDAVSSVQILENHQPIKILDSISPSDKASLNIKLKKNTTTTGTVYAMAGLSPLLYEGNITPMLFKKKEQLIASYQLNNSGNDASQQLNTLSIEELTNQLNDRDEPTNPLNIVALPKPSINSRQYLFNRLQMPTLQYLTKNNNGLEIKLSLAYINDHQTQQGNNSTTYSLENGNIILNEQIENTFNTCRTENSLVIQKNKNNIFYKNTLRFKGNWDEQNGNTFTQSKPIQQYTKNNFLAFSNNFKTIVPIRKQLVSLHSIINYHQQYNTLTVIPGVYSNILNNNVSYLNTIQHFKQYFFKTQQAAELIKQIKAYTVNFRAGLNTIQQQNNTSIEINDSVALPLPFKNNIQIQSLNTYITQEWNKKIRQGNMGIKLPIQYMQVNLKDTLQYLMNEKNMLTLNPEFYIRYNLNNLWQWNSSVSYQQKIDNYLNIYYGYILKSYRNLQSNPYPLGIVKTLNATTALIYRSTLHASFFNILYTYSNITQPYILNTSIALNGSQQSTAIPISNTIQQHIFNIRYSKTIYEWHSSFAIATDINIGQFKQYINQILTPTTNWLINTRVSYNGIFAKWGTVDYQINPQWLMLSIKNNNPNTTFLYSQILKYNHTLPADINILTQLEHYYNNGSVNQQNTFFADLLLRKQLKNKTDVELGVRNLFNNNYLVSTNINGYYTVQSGMFMRPRQVTAAIRFAF
ncbi:hypothetical protein [Hydrotalea sp.]|uniref:hypothetical protein n=1 Tax=Hydrotalea sp. TaxID=2881279 RepID=UPI003D0CA568